MTTEKFIKRFGGNIVGTVHKSCMFPDGSLHDSYIFEILKEDVIEQKFKIDGGNKQ